MFYFEHSVTGKIDLQRLWGFYEDVSNWNIWDSDISQSIVTHTVTIDGGDEIQMEEMGKNITAHIPQNMEQLISLSKLQ